MTKAQIAKAVAHRGRPPENARKQPTTLRLDQEVPAYFKAAGPGWQTRIGEMLRHAVKRSTLRTSRNHRSPTATIAPSGTVGLAKGGTL